MEIGYPINELVFYEINSSVGSPVYNAVEIYDSKYIIRKILVEGLRIPINELVNSIIIDGPESHHRVLGIK